MTDDTMKTLDTAVIGLGRAGWQMHIPAILSNEDFRLTAVVDPLQERLDEAKNEFNTRVYKDCESLFQNERPDLVVIASPTRFHAEQAICSFEHGTEVLCDKPLAPSLTETDHIIDSMKKNGRKLMVYQPHRAYADTVALKHILGQDLIGPVFMIKRAWTRYRFRVDWQAFRKYGGGELINSGAHFIDQLLHLSGSSVKRLSCFLRKVISRGDAEDVAKILIETKNGMILDLDINFASAIPITPFQVFGEHGAIIWDEEMKAWKVRFYHKKQLSGIHLQNSLAATDRSYCDDQDIPWQQTWYPICDFQPVDFYAKCYDYFALDRAPFIPIEETREIMRIIEMCRRDADQEIIEVPEL